MANKSQLQMVFLTNQNKQVRVSIANPKQPIDNTAVDNAMDLIVAKNIFAFPQGLIVNKVSASLVETDTSAVG
jgi:hypothetical protein